MGFQNGVDNGAAYEVHTSEELGRYLVASRDLPAGDQVLVERPVVFGPKGMPDPEATMPCVGCYKPVHTEVGERCPRCGWPVCSGYCPGLKDPRHHGLECEILSARPECVLDNMADYYRHDALLPLRCVLLQKADPENWERIMEMQSHMESRAPRTESYDEADEFIVNYIMNNFFQKLPDNIKSKYCPEITADMIHRICGIIDTNALEIRLPEGSELLALFAKTSLIEHSCVPNTKHTFTINTKNKSDIYKITMKVVVPVLKGSHLSTMYSHALWGTQARRQHLKDTKYFLCRCIRCKDPTELGTHLSTMKCLGDSNGCDGLHLPEDPLDEKTDWACNKCPVKVSSSQVNMIVSQMGEEVENVQMSGSITILENLLCRLSTFLHPNHYHLYSIKHSLIQLYGRQPGYTSADILDKKIRMCKVMIEVTKTLDPGNARLSLYSSVLNHELHSALVMKAKKAREDGFPKKLEEIKPLLFEAKTAILEALTALQDDTEETSGKKLYAVIKNSKKDFERFCKEKKLSL